jgi:selenocysteine-specific elongation factor
LAGRYHQGAGRVRVGAPDPAAPIGALAGDRIVLQDAGARHTIGGGVVVDPYPPARGRRTAARLAQFAALERRDPSVALHDLLVLPPGWVDRTASFRVRNMPPPAQAVAMAAALAVAIAGLAIAPVPRRAWEHQLGEILAEHHRAHPDEPGLVAARLRPLLPGRPPEAAFAALVEAMLRAGTNAQDGPWLRLAAHRAVLSAQACRSAARLPSSLQRSVTRSWDDEATRFPGRHGRCRREARDAVHRPGRGQRRTATCSTGS